ncbi:hypothetical protein EDC14_102372 [Hydrogenispora ethanolica]|uniref:Uncharacterized protein n=1 Tax=Hydrogenispora ethanolica TaxID=1082276 RepID=A0A4R1RAL4_HYDET|nr:hypothetical protein EDC14_102372 [Hydrogenispora ethanolica]
MDLIVELSKGFSRLRRFPGWICRIFSASEEKYKKRTTFRWSRLAHSQNHSQIPCNALAEGGCFTLGAFKLLMAKAVEGYFTSSVHLPLA